MESITYKGVEYPIRKFLMRYTDEPGENATNAEVIIAPQSLSEIMGEQKDVVGSEEELIDIAIYQYVADDEITLPAEIIANELISGPFEFVNER